MIARKYIVLLVLLFLFASCKDELTLPTSVYFDFGMISFLNEEPAQNNQKVGGNNRYTIESGELIVEAIEFDGKRNQGEDVYFMSSFTNKVIAQLDTHTSNFDVEFDIPQGEYNRVEVTLHLGNGDESPLKLQGQFAQGQSGSFPVRFEYPYTDRITIRARPQNGTNIVLSKDKLTTARVVVDTEFLFRFLNPGLIANAARVTREGQEVILINHQHNVDVFNQVANRFSNSISVVSE